MPTISQDTLDVESLSGPPLGGVSYGADGNGPHMSWQDTLRNSNINKDLADTFVIPGQVNGRRPNMPNMSNMGYPPGGYPQNQGYPQQNMGYPQPNMGYQQPNMGYPQQQATMPPNQFQYAQPQRPQLTPQQMQMLQMQQQQRMQQQQIMQQQRMQQQQIQQGQGQPQATQAQQQPQEQAQAQHVQVTNGEPFYEMILANNTYHFYVDLPGVDKNSVDVQYFNGAVRITGVRELQSNLIKKTLKGEKGKRPVLETKVSIPEYLTGKFEFSFDFPLPIDEDSVKGSFKDGVLHVTMELRASTTRGVKVAIQ